jgi:hypothetical protein
MSSECRQFVKVKSIHFLFKEKLHIEYNDYNSQNRWIALELLEEHEYLVEIVILVQLRWKNSFLECPCSSIIDRASRQQTESTHSVR